MVYIALMKIKYGPLINLEESADISEMDHINVGPTRQQTCLSRREMNLHKHPSSEMKK